VPVILPADGAEKMTGLFLSPGFIGGLSQGFYAIRVGLGWLANRGGLLAAKAGAGGGI
jgi:hypothetical protein